MTTSELAGISRSAESSTDEDRAVPADTGDAGDAGDAGTTLRVAGADVAVSGDPTDAEAAALATVLAEHLHAEARAEAEDEEPRYAVDPWRLAGRLGLRSPCGLPADCPSGREWKVAGRAATW